MDPGEINANTTMLATLPQLAPVPVALLSPPPDPETAEPAGYTPAGSVQDGSVDGQPTGVATRGVSVPLGETSSRSVR